MTTAGRRLRESIDTALPRLRAITEEESGRRSSPDGWSAREQIGHLIDSASNNHQRFVRARWKDDLVFDGYEGDKWVAVQQYNDAPWSELLTLWESFNRHLARVMDLTPDEIRLREHREHNLDERAFKTISKSDPATLDWFMHDYVDHLRHHLSEVVGEL